MARRKGKGIGALFIAGLMVLILIIAASILSLFGIGPFMWVAIELGLPASVIFVVSLFIGIVCLGFVFTNFNTVRKRR